jgi:general L-amino acid transport system substrate-binding protein
MTPSAWQGTFMRKVSLAVAITFAMVLCGSRADAGPVLDGVKARGQLVCGLGTPTAGFMQTDRQGKWTGFAVDICRAVSAAVLRDASKVKYIPLAAAQRFPALQAGQIDLLVANSTYTLARDAGQGVDFTGIYYYDGQGFLVKRAGAKAVKDLHRASICFQSATTTEVNLADYFGAQKLRFTAFPFDRMEEAWAAFLAGRCEALTADISTLHALRAGNAQHAKDYTILAQAISKEPFSPAVRHGDDQFADIVRWTLYAMIEAEEHGITSGNVDEKLKSGHATIKTMLGATPGMGKALGVDEKWVYDIVKQVGNYGESYDRNLGDGSALKIPRSLNALWTKAGILYVPPIR